MGYSTSGGTKGLGSITSPFTPRADQNQILTLLGEVGNVRVLTTAERDLLSGAKLYEGLVVSNTTTDQLERYTGSGWEVIWGRTPNATLARSTDLPNGVSATPTAAVFQSAPVAVGMSWSGGNPTRVVVPVAGVYLFEGVASIGSTTNGIAWLRVNGAAASPRSFLQPNSGGLATVPVLDVLTLAANDYVELMTQSAATFTLYAATRLTATLLTRR